MLYIASNTLLTPKNIPLPFKIVLENWLQREDIQPTIVRLNGVEVSKAVFK